MTCIPFDVNRDFKAAEERRRTELPLAQEENELEAADAAAFAEASPPVMVCPAEYRDWRRR